MPVVEANRIGRLHLPGGAGPMTLTRMTAVERLSEPFSIVIDAISDGAPLDLHPFLADKIGVEFIGVAVDGIDYVSRWFHGILWEYVELGRADDAADYTYRLTLRPSLELLTQDRASVIHAKKMVTDLITNLPGNFDKLTKLTATYEKIEYRVRYAESSFDFLARNLEKEGIYYYYTHAETSHTIVFIDAANNHPALVPATVELHGARAEQVRKGILTSLVERRSFGPTAYTTDDYDYTAPTQALAKTKTVASLGKPPPRYGGGEVSKTIGRVYDYPAGFDSPASAAGERYAARWLEREQRRMARSFAEGTVFAAAVGRTVTVDFSKTIASAEDAEYLIVAATHRYSAPGNRSGGGDEEFSVELELTPAAHQYRPARSTPVPRIHGPQTAVVIGPAGEEIYTDKYGRVKVRFFWDREGSADPEPYSAWVRVGQTGAGPGFGTFMIPRIGQEVIVEFLDGDPERPIVTGAVYNATNLPAFGDASNNTVQGLKTNSSKGGGGYNEIKIDDKKGSEMFSFHAQKDLKTVVDKGDETRDLNEGNRTTVIHKGNETTTITEGNVVHETSKGDVTRTIKVGKRTTEIMGNDTFTIKTGNRETTINTGNDKLTVSVGNVEIAVSVGSHKTTALQAVEITCGGSSIKMDPMSIAIKGMNVTIEGSLSLGTKGLMITQEASAIHVVKGAMVMIN